MSCIGSDSGLESERRRKRANSFGFRTPAVLKVLGGVGLTSSPIHLNWSRMIQWVSYALLRTFEFPLFRRYCVVNSALFNHVYGNPFSIMQITVSALTFGRARETLAF